MQELREIDGRFRILSLLGRGATADVYKAQHIILDRIVAIKILHSNRVESQESLQRFHQEARVMSQIEHAQIVTILGFGQLEDGRPYLVMDFVEGQTLAEKIANEGAFDGRRALPLFIQIADGMSAVHQFGILHRDLKPSNVMVSHDSDGAETAKVLDFGLVRGLSEAESQTLTKTGLVPGTPAYMSPEQCKGTPLGVQSDIYSLGCLMYETLCGTPPFSGASPLALMSQQVDTKVITVPGKKRLPPGLAAIVLKALQKDATKRQANMSELMDELKKCRDGELPLSFHKTRNKFLIVGRNAALPLLTALLIGCMAAMIIHQLKEKNKVLTMSDEHASRAEKLAREARNPHLLDLGRLNQIAAGDPSLRIRYLLDWKKNNPRAPLAAQGVVLELLASEMEAEENKTEALRYCSEAENAYKKRCMRKLSMQNTVH